MKDKLCSTCIWLSTGINDPRGAGYCYSEGDYVMETGCCEFWQESLRGKPLNAPLSQDKEGIK
jgi:hypothetical protein